MKKLIVIASGFLLFSFGLTSCFYDKELDQNAGGLPTNVSLSNDVQPIFTKNCALSGCHDATPTQKPSLVLGASYNALVQGGFLNVTVPTAGILYREISEQHMPPGIPLSSRDANMIIAWLQEGAKNN